MFASLLVVNAQSWLYYTDRLVEFPLGMFGVAIGTVILPHLSRRHADTDAAGYSHALDWGLRLTPWSACRPHWAWCCWPSR